MSGLWFCQYVLHSLQAIIFKYMHTFTVCYTGAESLKTRTYVLKMHLIVDKTRHFKIASETTQMKKII